jgi:hypothetical protein
MRDASDEELMEMVQAELGEHEWPRKKQQQQPNSTTETHTSQWVEKRAAQPSLEKQEVQQDVAQQLARHEDALPEGEAAPPAEPSASQQPVASAASEPQFSFSLFFGDAACPSVPTAVMAPPIAYESAVALSTATPLHSPNAEAIAALNTSKSGAVATALMVEKEAVVLPSALALASQVPARRLGQLVSPLPAIQEPDPSLARPKSLKERMAEMKARSMV